MNYKLPEIHTIDDVFPHIKGREEFVVAEREAWVRRINEVKARRKARDRRRMELGYDGWKQRSDGSFYKHTPKGIQHWYDTRTLVKLVEERMDLMESAGYGRICPINGKWRLQIRGKHMRRLLKARPNWKQEGRQIVEKNKC